ncbi:uncharacterized protein SAPINGB_P001332 [Magnusiomyces paraingens]|uniref:Uncharacterized protein n=1 Tax=Magnusiomyces paraingens TaxID=2606893 RepID=A0A5E8B5Q7_9ASCO|nr:uncharacterized protein SAPINGB_P001332 [Saprochaete ingens]VVT46677.1 unnamed protein product [Saprochaete ingens]
MQTTPDGYLLPCPETTSEYYSESSLSFDNDYQSSSSELENLSKISIIPSESTGDQVPNFTSDFTQSEEFSDTDASNSILASQLNPSVSHYEDSTTLYYISEISTPDDSSALLQTYFSTADISSNVEEASTTESAFTEEPSVSFYCIFPMKRDESFDSCNTACNSLSSVVLENGNTCSTLEDNLEALSVCIQCQPLYPDQIFLDSSILGKYEECDIEIISCSFISESNINEGVSTDSSLFESLISSDDDVVKSYSYSSFRTNDFSISYSVISERFSVSDTSVSDQGYSTPDISSKLSDSMTSSRLFSLDSDVLTNAEFSSHSTSYSFAETISNSDELIDLSSKLKEDSTEDLVMSSDFETSFGFTVSLTTDPSADYTVDSVSQSTFGAGSVDSNSVSSSGIISDSFSEIINSVTSQSSSVPSSSSTSDVLSDTFSTEISDPTFIFTSDFTENSTFDPIPDLISTSSSATTSPNSNTQFESSYDSDYFAFFSEKSFDSVSLISTSEISETRFIIVTKTSTVTATATTTVCEQNGSCSEDFTTETHTTTYCETETMTDVSTKQSTVTATSTEIQIKTVTVCDNNGCNELVTTEIYTTMVPKTEAVTQSHEIFTDIELDTIINTVTSTQIKTITMCSTGECKETPTTEVFTTTVHETAPVFKGTVYAKSTEYIVITKTSTNIQTQTITTCGSDFCKETPITKVDTTTIYETLPISTTVVSPTTTEHSIVTKTSTIAQTKTVTFCDFNGCKVAPTTEIYTTTVCKTVPVVVSSTATENRLVTKTSTASQINSATICDSNGCNETHTTVVYPTTIYETEPNFEGTFSSNGAVKPTKTYPTSVAVSTVTLASASTVSFTTIEGPKYVAKLSDGIQTKIVTVCDSHDCKEIQTTELFTNSVSDYGQISETSTKFTQQPKSAFETRIQIVTKTSLETKLGTVSVCNDHICTKSLESSIYKTGYHETVVPTAEAATSFTYVASVISFDTGISELTSEQVKTVTFCDSKSCIESATTEFVTLTTKSAVPVGSSVNTISNSLEKPASNIYFTTLHEASTVTVCRSESCTTIVTSTPVTKTINELISESTEVVRTKTLSSPYFLSSLIDSPIISPSTLEDKNILALTTISSFVSEGGNSYNPKQTDTAPLTKVETVSPETQTTIEYQVSSTKSIGNNTEIAQVSRTGNSQLTGSNTIEQVNGSTKGFPLSLILISFAFITFIL